MMLKRNQVGIEYFRSKLGSYFRVEEGYGGVISFTEKTPNLEDVFLMKRVKNFVMGGN